MAGVGRVTVSLRRSTTGSTGGTVPAPPAAAAPTLTAVPEPTVDPPPGGRGAAADPSDLLALARSLAVAAGEQLLVAVERERRGVATKTSPTDMVTETDRATERFLVESILAARPDDAVRGEEGADQPGSSGVSWWIDPIDGTTNFLYGLPGFNISVAAEIDGRVVAGVVVDPLHRDVFAATLGRGATRNGQAISCTAATDLASSLIATGFSYERDRRRRQAEVLTQVLPAVRDIRRVGAAATDLCAVACGRVDGFYERGLQPWDWAAGALIATEAGAVVTDLDGEPTSSAFTLAAAPGIHVELGRLLRRAGAAGA